MSNSWTKAPWQYVTSRLPGRLYVPCAALLVVAGLAGGREAHAADLAWSYLLAFSLLLQFRLLDDLSDLPNDRREHPDRVLVKAKSLAPFHALLAASCLLNSILITLLNGPGYCLVAFLLLSGAFLLWYCVLRHVLTGKSLGYHVVVSKYPMFVFLLGVGGAATWNLSLAMALIFLCFSIYEVLHDPCLHTVPQAERAMMLEIWAIFAVSALMTWELIGGVLAMVVLQGLLGLIGVAVLAEVFAHRRVHRKWPKAGYLVFAVAFALILNFSLGVRS